MNRIESGSPESGSEREHLMQAAELVGGITEAELDAFDKPAREVFKQALVDGADTTEAGEAFMRFYQQNAAQISDIGKEERAQAK
jgi:hypothetical protein